MDLECEECKLNFKVKSNLKNHVNKEQMTNCLHSTCINQLDGNETVSSLSESSNGKSNVEDSFDESLLCSMA